jgi:hypothetical protein
VTGSLRSEAAIAVITKGGSGAMMPGRNDAPEGFVLTVVTTVRSQSLAAALGIGGHLVPPGTVLEPESWPHVRNLAAMMSAGQIQWRPPQSLMPKRAPPPPPPVPKPIILRDYIAELRIRLTLMMETRGVDWSTATDMLIGTPEGVDLWQRAQVQFAIAPREVVVGDRVIRSGKNGLGGRSVEGFVAYLQQGSNNAKGAAETAH